MIAVIKQEEGMIVIESERERRERERESNVNIIKLYYFFIRALYYTLFDTCLRKNFVGRKEPLAFVKFDFTINFNLPSKQASQCKH
jgi:hypothetical protein